MTSNLTEVRWHARGGQGAVTAAKMVAELAVERGKHFQAFPEYGPERSGAPIVAFTRISDEPIQTYAPIEHPNVILVLDPTLLDAVDVTEGAGDGAIVIVNTEQSPEELKTQHDFGNARVLTVPATKIAKETIGRNLPNTPMVGAVAKAANLFRLEEVQEHLQQSFGKKFAPEVVQGNLDAVKRAFEEVRE
ncbi:MAG: 2-oxoacid:acceptor oxidoreductase family protein [Thermoleophilia bacterium]